MLTLYFVNMKVQHYVTYPAKNKLKTISYIWLSAKLSATNETTHKTT